MSNKFLILLSSSLLLLFTSCEEVIELELEDSSPRLVIEANGDMNTGTCTVHITQTNSFYETGNPPAVENASLELTDEQGTNYTFSSLHKGVYQATNIDFQAGENYQLTVIDENGLRYEAGTQAPFSTELDSLQWEEQAFGIRDTFFQVDAFWQDPTDAVNFYRIRLFIEEELQANEYLLYTDEFEDGEYYRRFLRYMFEEGDQARIQLMSIDKATYDYFLQLSDIQGQGLDAAIPFNPQGNFNNDALGYFGVNYTSELEVVIE